MKGPYRYTLYFGGGQSAGSKFSSCPYASRMCYGATPPVGRLLLWGAFSCGACVEMSLSDPLGVSMLPPRWAEVPLETQSQVVHVELVMN